MAKVAKLLKENDKLYGNEVKSKFGRKAYQKSTQRVQGMSDEMLAKAEVLSKEMMDNLKKAFELNDITCKYAKRTTELHKEWLCLFYADYSVEYHLALADMYVEDERFRKNYDVLGVGATEFFRDMIKYHVK